MTGQPIQGKEGSRMYSELLAVHTIMRRGGRLVTDSFTQLVSGKPVNVKALVNTARWFVGFVHHHHQSEDDLFWPVLRNLFPQAVANLDALTTEHKVLDDELDKLAEAIGAVSAAARSGAASSLTEAAVTGQRFAEKIEEILLNHLDAEEPVLQALFQRVPDTDIVRLRQAIVHSAPKTGPHLVFGLMEDPEQVPGYADMSANFPAILRLFRPALLRRYRSLKVALATSR